MEETLLGSNGAWEQLRPGAWCWAPQGGPGSNMKDFALAHRLEPCFPEPSLGQTLGPHLCKRDKNLRFLPSARKRLPSGRGGNSQAARWPPGPHVSGLGTRLRGPDAAGRDRRGPEVLIWVPVHACGTPSRPAPRLRSRPRDGSATWTSLILTTAGQLTLGHRSANQRPRVPARCQALAKAVATGALDPTSPRPAFPGRPVPPAESRGRYLELGGIRRSRQFRRHHPIRRHR